MKQEAQRIAIAEACGWKTKTYEVPADWMIAEAQPCTIFLPPGKDDKHENYGYYLPDYLSDLNAMHEAEKVLTLSQFWQYADLLKKACDSLGLGVDGYISATAAQRAEAFLRCIGKWKP